MPNSTKNGLIFRCDAAEKAVFNRAKLLVRMGFHLQPVDKDGNPIGEVLRVDQPPEPVQK